MSNEQTPDGPVDPTPSPAPSDAAGGGAPTSDERNLAILAHLLGILVWFVGALVIWLIKKDDSDYVADQSKEALNFQITITLLNVVAGIATLIAIGCFLLPVIFVVNVVFCIIAAIAASKGERYRYPLSIRLIS